MVTLLHVSMNLTPMLVFSKQCWVIAKRYKFYCNRKHTSFCLGVEFFHEKKESRCHVAPVQIEAKRIDVSFLGDI